MSTAAFVQGISTTLRPDEIVKYHQARADKQESDRREQEDREIRRTEAEAQKKRQERYDTERQEDRSAKATQQALETTVNEDIAMLQMGGEEGAQRLNDIMTDFFTRASAKNPKVQNKVKTIRHDPATDSYVVEDTDGGTRSYTKAAAEDMAARMRGLRNPGESQGRRTAGIGGTTTVSDAAITAWEADNIPVEIMQKMKDGDETTDERFRRARARVKNGEPPAAAYYAEGILDKVDEEMLGSTIASLKDKLAEAQRNAQAPDSEGGAAVTPNERGVIDTIINEGKTARTDIKNKRMGVPGVSGGEPAQQPSAGGTVTLRDPESGRTYTVKAGSAQKYLEAGYERVDN